MFSYASGDIPTGWGVEPNYILATISFLLSLFLFIEYQFGLLITAIFKCSSLHIFFFLCGQLPPPSGENAVGLSFKKKSYIFVKN